MSSNGKGKRIVELRAENFKRLKAITIRPNGTAVIVGGRNGQGKSSALDAIWAALAGAKAIPPEPIRRGEEDATISVDLGDLIVTRRFTKSGNTRVEVATREGAVHKSPQAVLDRLVGELSFDPLAFARQKPKDQAETLRELAGLDLDAIDREIADAFADRAAQNRTVARSKAQLESMPEVEEVERVSVDALLKALDGAQERNAWRETLAGRKRSAEKQLAATLAHIDDLRAQIVAAEKTAQDRRDALASIERDESLAMPIDEAPIRAALATAEETNRKADAYDRRAKAETEFELDKTIADELTTKLEDLRSKRTKLIASAPYPIEGLGVGDEGVTFNGLPLEQASSAEQVRVSAAIGLALNPELRVLLIRDGSLLDADSLAALVDQAEAADAQLWIERVGAGEEVSVVIEDGEARWVNPRMEVVDGR